MSIQSFHRMLRRTCSNGPMTNAQMQHEIDVIDRSVERHTSKCEDATPAYSR